MIIPSERPVRVLAAATVVTTLGSGLYLAGSMLFFTRVVGLGVVDVGTGLGIAMFVGVLSGVPLGQLADRYGPRGLYVGTQLLQAGAMFLFPFARTFPEFLAIVTMAAVGQRGGLAVSGALIARISAPQDRTRVRAYLRAVINLGMAVGVAAAGIALQVNSAGAYTTLILVNGVSFLLAAGLLLAIAPLDPVPAPPDTRRLAALRDRPYLALAVTSGILAFQYDVISLVLPLWLVSHTAAHRWWLSVLLVVNTGIVVLLQVRAARGVAGARSGAAALRRAGLLFLAGCVVVGASHGLPVYAAECLLLLGVLIFSFGEIGMAAGSFEVGYGLAPEHAQGQYQGAFNLAVGLVRAASPIVLSTLCLRLGQPGWLLLGAVFGLTGVAAGPLAAWAIRTRSFALQEVSVD